LEGTGTKGVIVGKKKSSQGVGGGGVIEGIRIPEKEWREKLPWEGGEVADGEILGDKSRCCQKKTPNLDQRENGGGIDGEGL